MKLARKRMLERYRQEQMEKEKRIQREFLLRKKVGKRSPLEIKSPPKSTRPTPSPQIPAKNRTRSLQRQSLDTLPSGSVNNYQNRAKSIGRVRTPLQVNLSANQRFKYQNMSEAQK